MTNKKINEEIQRAIDEFLEHIDNEHRYFYTNCPKGIKKLSKMELFDLGQLNDDIYLNPIVAAMQIQKDNLLNEAEYATYPVGKTIEYISDALNLPTHMFSIKDCYNGTKKIIIRTPNKRGLKANLDKAMHLCGYYLSNKDFYKDDGRFLELRYEPKYIDKANDIVRDNGILYHLSPMPYRRKILEKGFIPKSKSVMFKYPDRSYFFLGSMAKNEVKSWVKVFKNFNLAYGDAPYCLYTIDVNKIPDNVNFFLDPNLRGGCYTADNIGPQAICSIEEVE